LCLRTIIIMQKASYGLINLDFLCLWYPCDFLWNQSLLANKCTCLFLPWVFSVAFNWLVISYMENHSAIFVFHWKEVKGKKYHALFSFIKENLVVHSWLYSIACCSVGAKRVKNTCIQFLEFCKEKSRDGLVSCITMS
jgi:hypothetical protein